MRAVRACLTTRGAGRPSLGAAPSRRGGPAAGRDGGVFFEPNSVKKLDCLARAVALPHQSHTSAPPGSSAVRRGAAQTSRSWSCVETTRGFPDRGGDLVGPVAVISRASGSPLWARRQRGAPGAGLRSAKAPRSTGTASSESQGRAPLGEGPGSASNYDSLKTARERECRREL